MTVGVTVASFDEFYRASRGRTLQCVYALTGDLAEAQDVVQDAYVRAWEHWSRVSSYADPGAWVRTVALRMAVSRWRRARNRLTAHRRHGLAPPVPAPDESTVALVRALREIAPAQRMAIVLHHLGGYSVADIAAQTGVAEGTVKARLSRGRQALARLLQLDVAEESHA